MKDVVYISDEEREKCRKVKAAFAELENEEVGIMVADAGRYGYVRLRYYDMTYGFAETNCFTESSALLMICGQTGSMHSFLKLRSKMYR